MWKATAGHQIVQDQDQEDDDWETDPDFVNDVTEQEQRWGSKTIEGSGRTAGAIDMQQLRQEIEQADATRLKEDIEKLNPGFGYGGKFGVEKDRMDKSAVGHDYIGKVEKHASQKDYSDGFGGKFGVQKDRVDKSAVDWDHKEKVEKHSSQKDYSDGFGGKFGVQNDRVDKSAVGWDHIEKVEKHESQKDYSKGFGGKFGVQEDRKDKSAVGWDYVEAPQKHESQLDHKVGFGGKFGVQNDRMDKSAIGFQENPDRIGTNYTKTKPDIGGAKPSNLRAKFENFAKTASEEDQKRTAEQKRIREEKDRIDREQAAKKSTFESGQDESKPTQRRVNIDTGREGGISGAISAFNQVQSPTTETPIQRKSPIKIPKEPEPKQVVQPDIIPAQHSQPAVPPPAAFTNDLVPESVAESDSDIVNPPDEQLYSNVNKRQHVEEQINIKSVDLIEEKIHEPQSPTKEQAPSPTKVQPPSPTKVQPPSPTKAEASPIQEQAATVDTHEVTEHIDPIYQNQEDLTEYIEDTGVKAVAMYDYQAAADDEISFDPDDLITHIEQIDEGWWRGLCKNRYGLFPANYVQLQQ